MNNELIAVNFSARLRNAMVCAGFHSKNCALGVSVTALSDLVGCSIQMCRKYLRGEAIPSHSKIIVIAQALHVSPGWLVFGERGLMHDEVLIDNATLHYILSKTYPINHYLCSDDYAEYVTELIRAAMSIEGGIESRKIMIDAVINLSRLSHPHVHSIKKPLIDVSSFEMDQKQSEVV